MFFLLILLFVIGPIAEIYVLLQAGASFGVLPVVIACVATAIIGGWLIRLQGLAALNGARRDLMAGKAPVDSALDGALLVVAAPFLMTPGFLTDICGFALLIPPVRRAIGKYAYAKIRQRMKVSERVITIDHP